MRQLGKALPSQAIKGWNMKLLHFYTVPLQYHSLLGRESVQAQSLYITGSECLQSHWNS